MRVKIGLLAATTMPIFGGHFAMRVLADGYRCNGISFDEANASTIVGSSYLLTFS